MSSELTFHLQLTPNELNEQYNLQLHRSDLVDVVIPGWAARSEITRNTFSCELDIRYATGDNQCVDIFSCNNPEAPTLVYFHGGYWHRGSRGIYSFLAEPFIQAGVNVVIVGYDLCPKVSITQITQQARESIVWLYEHAACHGLNKNQIHIMGHSAGGHLVQMIMGTDWSSMSGEIIDSPIRSAVPISGLCFLEPVRHVSVLNDAVQLTEEEATAQSPLIACPPLTDAPMLLAVGELETLEFHRQSQLYKNKFKSRERAIGCTVVEGVDHFDILNVLADSNSSFFKTVLDQVTT